MLELAVKGNKWYWGWLVVLLGVIGAGFGLYLMQLKFGLGITGMSRDVSWGFTSPISPTSSVWPPEA
jgi:Ni/Fe-hydrogenase subunit HybB-like protein